MTTTARRRFPYIPEGVLDPAAAINAALDAIDAFPQQVTESTTSRNATAANSDQYTRFTNASAKTYTFNDSAGYVVGAEYHGRNVGAGDLTLTEAGGMTLNPPAGGSLVVPQGGAFVVRIVAADEADVSGDTDPP